MLLGGVHGMVLLPVVLSICGGSKAADAAEENGNGNGAADAKPASPQTQLEGVQLQKMTQ